MKRVFYLIEDVSPNTIDRLGRRIWLQNDGTFATSTGFARKKFKTLFFAKCKLLKLKNCRIIKIIRENKPHTELWETEEIIK